MKSFIQNNTATVLILIATVALAGVATFTAVRLYQLRVQPVSPVTPQESNAQALPTEAPVCRMTFSISLGSPVATASASSSGSPRGTATPRATSSATPRATATATPIGGLGGLTATATPTATATARATSSATPKVTASPAATAAQLPNAGSTFPTLVGIATAILLLITAFALAL